MAKVWFSVIVLFIAQTDVFAFKSAQRPSCDECIRYGGSWCSERTEEHCVFAKTDVFCGGRPEELTKIDVVVKNGPVFYPRYMERTLLIGNEDSFPFAYSSPVERKVSPSIYNTTQSFDNIVVKPGEVQCSKNKCTVDIEAKVLPEFCTSVGTTHEFVYVKIQVDNMTEEAMIKYHVPCACECSKMMQRKSPKCSGQGDFSCGVCQCYKGWKGEACDDQDCGPRRGDTTQCINPLKSHVNCSGNGYCGHCDTCVCYDDREGSQYFNQENYCSDICMDSSDCGQCFANGTLGLCKDSQTGWGGCSHQVTLLAYNETTAAQRDENNRKIWARCKETVQVGPDPEDTCDVEYVASKYEDSYIDVMVISSCNDHSGGGLVAQGGGTVPIVLGVLGIIAAVAAVGGVLLWKHMNAVPPMPFSSPDYQNIDAEDCVGQNPLYKSPTTTFTNPQYGKC